MNAHLLNNLLIEEGCNPSFFSIGNNTIVDGYCLSKKGLTWNIYYSERGVDSKPIHKFFSESKACKEYYKIIMSIQHRHLVGFFEQENSAIKLVEELERKGISAIRNDMGALKQGKPKIKRVFVVGKDIFKVREMYASIPRRDF